MKEQQARKAHTVMQSRPKVLPIGVLGLVVCLIALSLWAMVPNRALVSADYGPEQLPIVRCEPAPAVGTTDSDLAVDLYVEGVTGLYGVDLELYFNPAQVQVVGEDVQAISDWLAAEHIFFRNASNSSGYIHYAVTQMDPTPPVDGEGSVARIYLSAPVAGTYTMSFGRHDLSPITGSLMPNDAQDCTIIFNLPTAVTLSSLAASAGSPRGVVVQWETASEVDALGFYLYRAASVDGLRTKVNSALVPAKMPGSSVGASYEFVDLETTSGLYYYWLEVVDVRGGTEQHGPVSVLAGGYRLYLPLTVKD
jgi:hypothetical protein